MWCAQPASPISCPHPGDSQHNYYHNLCDFVNLFLSVYVAGQEHTPLEDIEIMYWEPERAGNPPTQPFATVVQALYQMFTPHPIRLMTEAVLYDKTLCFDHAVFAVKPRTIGTFFYNQYMPPGCIANSSDSFMRKFSDSAVAAVLGDAGFRQARQSRLRVTVLSRSAGTGYTSGTRKVLNEDSLLRAARTTFPFIDIRLENFDWTAHVPFVEQLARIRETDVLIGMHGAGLAHTIFLHPWSSVIEVRARS